jgi:hypothetical protein
MNKDMDPWHYGDSDYSGQWEFVPESAEQKRWRLELAQAVREGRACRWPDDEPGYIPF